jgi:hypothetical protein
VGLTTASRSPGVTPKFAFVDSTEDLFGRDAKTSTVRALVVSGCLLATALTYARLYFGVDLDDEAFHVVVPYRYVLGARPFVDEINITQVGAGLLAYPFFAAYYHLVGLDGIILFSRHLYFLFALGIAAAVFFSLRVLLRSAVLVLPISLFALAFIPHNRPSLNYDALGSGFFTAGCFLGIAYTENHRRRYLVLAGLTHGLSVFSYPTLVIPVAAYGVALYFISGRSRSAVAGYASVAALPAIAWIAVFFNDGIESARHVLALSRATAEERSVGADRAISIIHDAAANFLLAPLALAALVGAVLVHRRRPKLAIMLLAALPFLALPARAVDISSTGASIHYVANLGLLALPLSYALRTDSLVRRLVIGAWIPGCVAGWTISWSTFDGGGHQGLGFFPAAIAAAVLLALAVHRICLQEVRTSPWRSAPVLVPLLPLAALAALQFTAASHDSKPFALHSHIAGGPYAGLLTTGKTSRFVSLLTSDLRRMSSARCNILFYYDLPAGYLLSASPPYTNTAFLSDRASVETERQLVSYYASRGRPPDVAVRITRVPYLTGRPRYLPGDPLDALVRGRAYERAATTASYVIYVRRAGACTSA